MKAGVRTIPCGVAISPVRAAPSLASRRKEKVSFIQLLSSPLLRFKNEKGAPERAFPNLAK
jgi:hypothetical protein